MYKITYCSIQGKDREVNEDALLIQDSILKECGIVKLDTSYLLLGVSDGMGGYARGELASYIVLNSLKNRKPKNCNDIVISLIQAREKLDEISKNEKIKLGATIAGLLKIDDEFLVFNVGDCRVYKILSNGEVILKTKGHTLINQLKEFGIDKLAIEKQEHILTSAIMGGTDNKDFEIFHTKLKLKENEKLLICSDGFWRKFENKIYKTIHKRDVIRFIKKSRKNLEDDCSFILLEKQNRVNNIKKFFLNFKNLLN